MTDFERELFTTPEISSFWEMETCKQLDGFYKEVSERVGFLSDLVSDEKVCPHVRERYTKVSHELCKVLVSLYEASTVIREEGVEW